MKCSTYVIISLFVFISLVPSIMGQNIETLNSAILESASVKFYEAIDVYEDSTFNTYYIKIENKNNLNLDFRNEEEFHVWDYSVTINDKQEKFIPRPQIGDPIKETDNKYYFKDTIHLNESKENFLIISFWMNNVDGNHFWFPFDKYKLKLQDKKIIDNSTTITKFIFHGANIEPYIDVVNEALIKFYRSENKLSIPHKLVHAQDSIITTESGLSEGSLGGISITTYAETKEGYEKTELQPYTTQLEQVKKVKFGRKFFPAIFLFLLLGIYVIYLTVHTFWLNKSESLKNKKDKFYHIYINIALPIIITEFTVSFLPPLRPTRFTLFDTTILWPLIIVILVYFVMKILSLKKK